MTNIHLYYIFHLLGILLFAGLAISSVINNLCLKEFIERPRPYNLDPEVWANAGYEYVWPGLIKQSSSWSFPSGHTSSSFAFATAVFANNKKWGIAAYVLAALIGFSRIYLGVHYCTDVLAGAVVGIIYGVIGVLVVGAIIKLIKKKDNKLSELF